MDIKSIKKIVLCGSIFVTLVGCHKEKETLASLRVRVNGDELELYKTLQDVKKDDWTLGFKNTYVNGRIKAQDTAQVDIKQGSEGIDSNIRLQLYNQEKQAIELEKAQIKWITISDIQKGKIQIELPGDIDEDSTYQDVLNAYGKPGNFSVYRYSNKDEHLKLVYNSSTKFKDKETITIEFINDKVSEICFQAAENKKELKKDISFDYETVYGYKPVYDFKDPQVTYPEVLEKGEVIMDGTKIKKGDSLQVFIADNWKISKSYNIGNEGHLALTKGNDSFYVILDGKYVKQSSMYQKMKLKGITISFKSYKKDVSFPGGLTNKSNAAEIIEVLGTPQSLDTVSNDTYMYYQNLDLGDRKEGMTSIQCNQKGEIQNIYIQYKDSVCGI